MRKVIGVSCLIQVSTALIPPSVLIVQRRTSQQYQKQHPTCRRASFDEQEYVVTIGDSAVTNFDEVSWPAPQHHDLTTQHVGSEHHHQNGNSQFGASWNHQSRDLHNGLDTNGHYAIAPINPPLLALPTTTNGEAEPSESLSVVEEAIVAALTATGDEEDKQFNHNTHWKRRHARSIQEGIRRETTTQLSSLFTSKSKQLTTSKRHYVARTIMGLLNALADEADGLEVEVQTRPETPLWRKQVDAVQIRFSRLGIQPLRMGGLYDDMQELLEKPEQVYQLANVSCADEAFRRMDADHSGALDGDEIAQALNLAASTDTDAESMQGLASQLVDLYDLNGDGVIDREEYQHMVEDMAALRRVQKEKQSQQQSEEHLSLVKRLGNILRWAVQSLVGLISTAPKEIANKTSEELFNDDINSGNNSSRLVDTLPKGSGTITFSDMKLDLRQLAFGAIPIIKRITPGGPLILEPFTATLIGSFNKDDVTSSSLLDAGLRRLVARALRRRVRSFRDLVDMAVFYGRDWNMASKRAPQVEVAKLTLVEFDAQDRMVITGRVRIRTSPDAPIIENAFKVRTKIGTRKGGQVIRLVEPELALVAECPKGWERNIVSVCKKLGLPIPVKPEPLYAFFPIYSPFKVEDNDGFDMGEDNCIKTIYIKDGALRFEMSCVLRPGRFLGNHYIAFSFPQRTFIITLDRVRAGMRAARTRKQARIAAQAANKKRKDDIYHDAMSQSLSKHPQILSKSSKDDLNFFVPSGLIQQAKRISKPPARNKSFFSRFVEGYLGVSKEDEVRNERLTMAISDWFGRQGLNATAER